MADTARTRAALVALLADNTTGAISPQDLRDFLATAKLYGQSSVFRASGTVTAGTPGDIACDTSTGSFALTLFGSDESPADGVRRYYRIHNEDHDTENLLTVLPPAGETFECGITKLIVGSGERVTLSNKYDATAGTWVHLDMPPVKVKVARNATWAASNSTTTAAVPFDTTVIEENSEVLSVSSASAITIGHGGSFDATWSATIESTGGSSWNAIGYIAQDGTEIDGSRYVLSSKFASLPETMNGTLMGVYLSAGTVLSLRIGNTSLDGGIAKAALSVRRVH